MPPERLPTERPPVTDSRDAANPYGSGRSTPQRRLIAETAARMRGAFSVDELAARVRDIDEATGVATVYRAVAALHVSGWLERVGERGGSVLFARCRAGSQHHHHVICDGCGRIEATPCPVAPALGTDCGPSHTDPSGFIITRHEVALYGLCPTCAAERGSRSEEPSADATERA